MKPLLRLHALLISGLLICGVSLMSVIPLNAAEIRVLCTGAAQPAYEELKPQFERATGHTLITEYDLPPALIRKIDAGAPFDVLILSTDVADLIGRGKLAADSRTILGRYGIGIAIPVGSTRPDFSTVDAFKQMLLEAKAISTSGEGSSGRYVLTLLDRLGIADQVKPKIRSGPGGAVTELVVRREVDFAVVGRPPTIGAAGIEWAGLLPPELQSWLLFTAGLSTSATQPAAGRALLSFLTTPAAAAVLKARGLEPPGAP